MGKRVCGKEKLLEGRELGSGLVYKWSQLLMKPPVEVMDISLALDIAINYLCVLGQVP